MLTTAPLPDSNSTAALVFALQAARAAGDNRAFNRTFVALNERVEPTLRKHAAAYSQNHRRTAAELRNECLLELSSSAAVYTPEKAAAGIDFERFLSVRLKKHLAKTHHENLPALAGAKVKLLRTIARLKTGAAEAGVDTSDTEAVMNYAVTVKGARLTILRRQLPLIAGTISLNTPLRGDKTGAASELLDFIADSTGGDTSEISAEHIGLALDRVRSLTSPQRLVIELRFGLTGELPLSFAEIARREKKDASSIATRYQAAMKHLRVALRAAM